MIEMNTVSTLERSQPVNATQAADNQAANPASPVAPAARQGEAMAGVQVEISSAAREVAARDALPQTQNATAPANAAQESTSSRPAANETEPQAATQTEDRGGSSAQARAMQMFAETAGIGLEQANNSALRESV